jgi:hypothetical protein
MRVWDWHSIWHMPDKKTFDEKMLSHFILMGQYLIAGLALRIPTGSSNGSKTLIFI